VAKTFLRRKTMMKEVGIIGGSAAGFFTANLLANQGLRVRVFEADDHIDPSPRTLIVTDRIRGLLGSLPKSAVVNEIHHFELITDGRSVTIPLQRADLVIERSTLIKELKAQAEANGVKVLTGRRFLSLKYNGKRLTFTLSRNGKEDRVEESANILVGADGAFSKVAESAGWQKQPTVSLCQAVLELPKDIPPHTTRIWFFPGDTPYFYWLIPHSSTEGVLGLIGEEGRESQRSLERFLEREGLVPIEFQNAQISQYTRWAPNHRKIGEAHVYLVGDAAGHVKVSTVGGIVTGFQGALGVADAILNGGSSRELQRLRRELDWHKMIRRALHNFGQSDYTRLLDLMTPSIKRSLRLFSRDETKKLLLHVFLRQPRLLLLGLRAFLIRK
jgi:flavin-dependent dehydrogenase